MIKIQPMKPNYRKLGQYIRPVNIRNTNLKVNKLLGVSIRKVLMPSIANLVGTNMKTYKIIKKYQFAYGPVTSRNGDKISVALLKEFDEAIISQAYTVFKIIDTKELLPEYLMMWFRRPEFDRYARYKSHGSARETFDWDEMCEVELPVPEIKKQEEIVKEYNTVVNRIKLNEKLNQKLEETAQAIYKHWFVDFEFPDKDGKPYKSNGGKMVYNEVLEKEIPVGWSKYCIGKLCNYNISNYNNNNKFKEILYLDTSNLTNNKIEKIKHIKIGTDLVPSRAKRMVKHNDIAYSTVRPNLKHYGLIKYPADNMIVSTGFVVLNIKSDKYSSELIFQSLIQEKVVKSFQSKAEMSVSTYPSIKAEDLLNLTLPLPKNYEDYLEKIKKILDLTYNLIFYNNKEVKNLWLCVKMSG